MAFKRTSSSPQLNISVAVVLSLKVELQRIQGVTDVPEPHLVNTLGNWAGLVLGEVSWPRKQGRSTACCSSPAAIHNQVTLASGQRHSAGSAVPESPFALQPIPACSDETEGVWGATDHGIAAWLGPGMESGNSSAPRQGKAQACTCASPAPALLEGKMTVVRKEDMVYLDPTCSDTPKWAVWCSAPSEKHVFWAAL